ncbi:hypothetical protein RhiirC2_793510 [Rhizophagus irregularis]|uniref:Endonuclease/exonuclease/phosphatase domain-containing protein n=1 Tax=Rhizophagus irregularis TaxID=588596 RepID=A0A2N1MF99_9GLOM|nr:hypothetical protein RhiirC2_793510 [Rhizophagus irregularis]
MGSGTGILIRRELDTYVFNKFDFKGRIIGLDLNFKGNLKIRIIQCYIPTTGAGLTEILIFHQELKRLIDQAKHKNYEIVLMGDFNNHYDKYLERRIRGKCTKAIHNIFKYFEDKLLFDSTTLLFDINKNNNRHTFERQGNDNNMIETRIDYIWTTNFLALQINSQKLYRLDGLTTDHLMLITQFNAQEILNLKQLAKLKKQNRSKMIYAYDDMSDEDWKKYKEGTKELVLNQLKTTNCTDEISLNNKWIDKTKENQYKSKNNKPF